MKTIRTLFLAATFFVIAFATQAQVGINATGAAPDGSAMLDVNATNKG